MKVWFGRRDRKPAIRVGLSEHEVTNVLGPPHRQTNTSEMLKTLKSAVIIGGPLPEQSYWLYLNQPPGYDTQITMEHGRVVNVREVPTKTGPHPHLNSVIAAAEGLPAAAADDVQRDFLKISQAWGAMEILVLSADELRQRVGKILSDDADSGYTEVSIDTNVDDNKPPPYVQLNLLGSSAAPLVAGRPTWRPYRMAKRKDSKYALYGHQAMYR